jgi:hypothetical protein
MYIKSLTIINAALFGLDAGLLYYLFRCICEEREEAIMKQQKPSILNLSENCTMNTHQIDHGPLLKPKLIYMIFKNSVLISKKTQCVSITKINFLMWFKEITTVYSENHANNINIVCGQEFDIKAGDIPYFNTKWRPAK